MNLKHRFIKKSEVNVKNKDEIYNILGKDIKIIFYQKYPDGIYVLYDCIKIISGEEQPVGKKRNRKRKHMQNRIYKNIKQNFTNKIFDLM